MKPSLFLQEKKYGAEVISPTTNARLINIKRTLRPILGCRDVKRRAIRVLELMVYGVPFALSSSPVEQLLVSSSAGAEV